MRSEQSPRRLTPGALGGYAFSMPDPAQSAPHKARNSFADLLASLTGKLQSDGWDDSALADDVTTISYEQALRSARRARMPQETARPAPSLKTETGEVRSSPARKTRSRAEKNHKAASITIRVTAGEHIQLHERAAAAQLSVSAYIRSCIFEAEALRAEVKEALAQIQSPQTTAKGSNQEAPGRWRWGLFPGLWRGRTAES
jgi:hypothetical protein